MSPRYLLVGLALTVCCAVPAVASADETVMVCDIHGDHISPRPSGASGIATSARCPGNPAPTTYDRTHPPGGMAIWTLNRKVAHKNGHVEWLISAPVGLRMLSVYAPHMYSEGINDGDGWTGGFKWSGGSNGMRTTDGEVSWNSTDQSSRKFVWPSNGTPYFGWQVRCSSRRCTNGGHQWLSLEFLELHVRETSEPRLLFPDGLWRAEGWVRGEWKLHIYGKSPSGLCEISVALNGKPGPAHVSNRNTAVWHQCSAPPVDELIDTTQFGQGRLPLTISGRDAAGLTVTANRTIEVDNQRPTISLTGPTEASTTAGAQYIHAVATAGPSGVAGIQCSLDNSPFRWHAGSRSAVAVHGVGVHHLVCYSENNARDAEGRRAVSAAASWTLTIRSPSVSTLTFDRIGSALRCANQHERERVPGHWSIQYRNGQKERVWSPPRTKSVTVVRCHLRVVRKTERRDGRWVTTTTLQLPRHVSRGRIRVPFGKPVIVSGWLGAPDQTALGNQPVRILTAPADGSTHLTQTAIVHTSRTGIWTARLPAGPSRVIVATYPGATGVEPSYSAAAHAVVPAGVRLRIAPRNTHWGDTIRISGVVRGSYIPPKGEIVFLHVGWRGGSAEIGYVYTDQFGHFSTKYTFLRGRGTETYRMWATTGAESDYPYAPGRSNRVRVTVRQ